MNHIDTPMTPTRNLKAVFICLTYITIALTFLLSSATAGEVSSEMVVGKWKFSDENSEGTWTFNANGSYNYQFSSNAFLTAGKSSGTWKLAGDVIVLKSTDGKSDGNRRVLAVDKSNLVLENQFGKEFLKK